MWNILQNMFVKSTIIGSKNILIQIKYKEIIDFYYNYNNV